MRVVTIACPGQVQLKQVDVPEPGPGDVLIRVAACGLCTTDVDILEGRFWGSYPIVPGHEISGFIEDAGPDVTSLRRGDIVAVDPNIPCGKCGSCRSGSPHLCTDLRAIGVTQGGYPLTVGGT